MLEKKSNVPICQQLASLRGADLKLRHLSSLLEWGLLPKVNTPQKFVCLDVDWCMTHSPAVPEYFYEASTFGRKKFNLLVLHMYCIVV